MSRRLHQRRAKKKACSNLSICVVNVLICALIRSGKQSCKYSVTVTGTHIYEHDSYLQYWFYSPLCLPAGERLCLRDKSVFILDPAVLGRQQSATCVFIMRHLPSFVWLCFTTVKQATLELCKSLKRAFLNGRGPWVSTLWQSSSSPIETLDVKDVATCPGQPRTEHIAINQETDSRL